MPSLVSQAVSQSVNNIYWVPNERGCHETERRQGSWPWGAARTMMESEKRQRHAHRKQEQQRLRKGLSRGWAPRLCWAPAAQQPCHSLGLLISELIGYSNNPVREVVLISTSLSFLTCKINSSEQSRCGKARVGAVCPTVQEVRGHWNLAGEAVEQRRALATAVWGSLHYQAHFLKSQVSNEGQNYEIPVFGFGWGDDKRITICTFGSSTCSVVSYLCDLC